MSNGQHIQRPLNPALDTFRKLHLDGLVLQVMRITSNINTSSRRIVVKPVVIKSDEEWQYPI